MDEGPRNSALQFPSTHPASWHGSTDRRAVGCKAGASESLSTRVPLLIEALPVESIPSGSIRERGVCLATGGFSEVVHDNRFDQGSTRKVECGVVHKWSGPPMKFSFASPNPESRLAWFVSYNGFWPSRFQLTTLGGECVLVQARPASVEPMERWRPVLVDSRLVSGRRHRQRVRSGWLIIRGRFSEGPVLLHTFISPG